MVISSLRVLCKVLGHGRQALPLGLLLLPLTLFAQTTYSPYEESMAQYANNALGYALKYDSLQRLQPALDSCARFLHAYPNSFAKPNVLSYMLEMTSYLTTDTGRINPLIDSVLAYDSLWSTKMGIGKLLIEHEIDTARGVAMIQEALPYLSYPYERYQSYLTLSAVDLSRGFYGRARREIEAAIGTDSSRLDAWYAYLGYYQLLEDPSCAARTKRQIAVLLHRSRQEYNSYIGSNPLVGKSILTLQGPDLDGNAVSFKRFEGSVTVINTFNFFCTTPAKQFPLLRKLIDKYPQVHFVFLNHGETPEELRQRYFTKPSTRFLKRQVVVFPDTSMRSFFGGGGLGMGEIILIDKAGNVRYSFPGISKTYEKLLDRRIGELVEED